MDTVGNPRAELTGAIEAIPARMRRSTSSCAPRCSSTSTTRRRASASSRRVTRPGGRVLLSTHGAMVYHPNPVDLWRWTRAGLERLFRRTATGHRLP